MVCADPTTLNSGQVETPAGSESENINLPNQEQFSQTEASNAIERYNEKIKLLESKDGAYNIELSENLVGLGVAYSALGQYSDALEAYSRALHIDRVNNGLENLNQISTLERMIEVKAKKEDWKGAAKNYDYLLWLYNRNFEVNDPALIPIFYRAANWNLDSFEMLPYPNSISFLMKAAFLFNKIINILHITKGMNDPQLIPALYGIANTNVKIVEPYGKIKLSDINLFAGEYNYLLPRHFGGHIQRQNGTANNQTRILNYSQERLSNVMRKQEDATGIIINSYRSGKNALHRIVDIYENNPSLPKESHAYALTHLGDWYLRFRKRTTALEYYLKAHELLKHDAVNSRYVDHLFSKPQSLDVIGDSMKHDVPLLKSDDAWNEPEDPDKEQSLKEYNFAELKFDVSEYGSVENLEIIESSLPDSVSFKRMVKEKIRFTPFRPRFENGKPVSTTNVKMLYRFN